MSSKPHQDSSGEAPRDNKTGARSLKLRRPVRKLFEPEAQPLDSALPPLSTIRPRRRPRLWLVAALLALTIGSMHPLASEGERPGQSAEAANPPPVDPAEHPGESPLTNGIPAVEDALVETNGFVETNEVVLPIPATPEEPAQIEGHEGESAPVESPAVPSHAVTPEPPAARSGPPAVSARKAAPPPQVTTSTENTVPEPERTARAASPNNLEFAAFRIITERNIFDPNRSPRRPQSSSRPKPVSVDAFSLVGIMSYEKGTFAFFDGTSSEFRKALKPDGAIAGFTVRAIEGNTVRLASAKEQLDLQVGMQLRREDQGQWRVAEAGGNTSSYGSSTAPTESSNSSAAVTTSTGGSSGGGSADEVLKRLMQRREQE